jgi:kynurenine formamidase
MITDMNIEDIRAMGLKYSNWARWGEADELGTLNHIGPEQLVAAASLVSSGKCISLALPYDQNGPHSGGTNRFNPIHLMVRDGADISANTYVRDFSNGQDRYLRATDDILIMPLQCGTQWDGLSHIFFEGRMYNGFGPEHVTSKGALRNDVAKAADRMVGRGLLIDLPRFLGVEWLDPGFAISGDLLDRYLDHHGLEARQGDFVIVRTGHMGHMRMNGGWGTYVGGEAPGFGLESVPWIAGHRIAGIATDTWGMEVLPNETADVFQPLHVVLIVHMGLWVGEIFDLEALAADCAADGVYEFLFSAAPLPITGAVGSPVNPLALK